MAVLPLPLRADDVDDLRGRVDRLEKEVRDIKYTLQALVTTSGDPSSRLLNTKRVAGEPDSSEESSAPPAKGKDSAETEVVPSGQLTRKELADAAKNMPVVLSQARAVPYLKHGDVIGVRLTAIREGSLFDVVGIRNGDVVVSANDELISEPEQLAAIFKTSARREINEIVVLRKGRETRLRYEVKD